MRRLRVRSSCVEPAVSRMRRDLGPRRTGRRITHQCSGPSRRASFLWFESRDGGGSATDRHYVMRPVASTTIDYASKVPTPAVWPRSIVAAFALCVPDILMWFAMFVNPRLGFSDALAVPFLIAYLLSWIAAVVGIVLVCSSKKSTALWVALAIFIAVPLLNIYGFLWGIGAAVAVA